MPEEVARIDDANIEEKVWNSELPAVLDFWEPESADYCNKEKVLTAVAKDYQDQVSVYRVDVRSGEKAVAWADMRAFPTLVFAHKKEIVETSIGILRKTELVRLIDRNLEKLNP